jgi:16S rRNA (adenine1518-N6/adenine1519-N6)-dimethyltransferase
MLESYKPSVLNGLLKKHDIHLSKGLGQNFITDGNIVGRIADFAALSPEESVLEIGAGAGALTTMLSRRAGRVIAIEIDRRLIPLLNEVLDGADNVMLIHEDCMKILGTAGFSPSVVVGNLPYYITSPVIMRLLEGPEIPTRMVFMVQREVAERIASPPGSRVYGAISVLTQYHCETELCMDVSREVFLPKPKVDSAVLRLKRRAAREEQPVDEALFAGLVRAGFGQRRKTLRNALTVFFADRGIEAATRDTVFAAADIDPGLRAERLSVEAFIRLANSVYSYMEGARDASGK